MKKTRPERRASDFEKKRLEKELDSYTTELRAQNEELNASRFQTEEALDKYRELYDFSPAGILSVSSSGVILECNLAACELLGYPRKDIVGKNLSGFVSRKDYTAINKFISSMISEPARRTIEIEAVVKDESSRFIQIAGHSFTDVLTQEKVCKIALLDITAQKTEQEEIKKLNAELLRTNEGLLTEIAERKRIERSQTEVAEKYSTLFNTTSDGILIHDTAGRILEANDAYCKMSGYGQDELLSMNAALLEGAGSEASLQSRVRRLIDMGGGDRFETTHVRKDGRVFDVDVTALYFERGGGRIAIFVRDISEKKRSEAALRESEAHFRALAEALPQIVWSASPGGGIDWFNMRWYEYTGEKQGSGEGWTWERVVLPEDLAGTLSIWEKARDTGTLFQNEIRIRRHDGEYRWFLVRAWPLKDADGNVVLWFGTNTDIHELKETEAALIQSRADLDRAQSVGQIGSWRLDVTSNLLAWSEENYRIFGIEKGTPLDYETFLSRIHPDDRDFVDSKWKAGLSGEHYDIEHRIIVGGEVKWVREKAYLECDLAGRLLGGFGITQDITERKRAEAELARLAEQRQLALDAARMGWWHYDPLTGISKWDEGYRRIFGVTGYELPNEEILARIFPEDLHGVWARVEAALDPVNSAPYSAEYRIRLPDGSVKWIEAHGLASFEGTGEARRPSSLVGTVADITERKLAAEKLASENREMLLLNRILRVFTESRGDEMFDGVLDVVREGLSSTHGVFGYIAKAGILVCPSLSRMLDECEIEGKCIVYPPEKWKGLWGRALTEKRSFFTNDSSIVPPGHPAIANNLAAPILFSGQAIGLLNLANKSGGYTEADRELIETIAERIAPLLYAWIQAMLLEDERASAERAIRESETRLKRAQEIAGLGSWELDLVSNKLTWSDEVYRIFGLALQDLDATYEAFLERVHPEDRKAVDDAYTGSIIEGRDHYEIEHRVVRKSDSGIRIVHEKCEHRRDESGMVILSIGMVHDITERKRAEEILARDKETLERIVEQRTEQLIEAQLELEKAKRLSDIGILAATVAHELRNPLAAINMAAYNIKKKAGNQNLASHLDSITKKVKESDQIINNLLFYSRIRPPSFETVRINSVIEDCIHSLSIQLDTKKRLSLSQSIASTGGTVIEGDPLQIKEVFSNLLANAYDAIPEIDGKIGIRTADYHATIEVFIEDNGSGIETANLPKIFDPFFTTKAKGTGLGLSVCRQIVSFHNGSINVKSERGIGTSFTVILPKRRDQSYADGR